MIASPVFSPTSPSEARGRPKRLAVKLLYLAKPLFPVRSPTAFHAHVLWVGDDIAQLKIMFAKVFLRPFTDFFAEDFWGGHRWISCMNC